MGGQSSELRADESFLQAADNRPKAVIMEENHDPAIPLIDLSESEDEVVKKVGKACRDWGFFQVTNHGVDDGTRRRMDVAMREFFGASAETKAAVRRDETRVLGYYDGEHTKNVKDWKEGFDFAVEDRILAPDSGENGITEWRSQWPESQPQLRETCEEYAKEVQKLCKRVMEVIALSLGLASNRFEEFFTDQTSDVKLIHYPPCPIQDVAHGVGPHKDGIALTVLAQDNVGGLEVKRKADGIWIPVKPNPSAYIINLGDVIQVWSNDKYESVDHRVVVNCERERFSIPFFLAPSHYIMVEPLHEFIDDFNPPKYQPYNWGKFLVKRKGSNFRKLDVENIQIRHFKVPEAEKK